MSINRNYWDNVWEEDKAGTYSYIESRIERALDKIGLFIQNGIEFKPNERVLEAGCGDGLILLALMRLIKVNGYGVDFSEVAKKKAIKLMGQEENFFDYRIADVEKLPFEDNYFDKIISLGVIEHFNDPRKAIDELYRTLKPGGLVILMTPNKLSLGVLDRVIKEVFNKWQFGYQTEYTPKQLSRLMEKGNFKTVKYFSNLRRGLENDTTSFKLISTTDQMVNVVNKNWGFYSYTIAEKI
ncbi:class I SAM-dependent methyltransferase [Evansella clarkii]|uniref:class I SAM-dependent methyltransferase n=1 Tax=Evansella clarkii TaxID=79879 RepID=UPI001F21680D|nr:class I SAM-dependent methyltransferase [Evansella clarkii]